MKARLMILSAFAALPMLASAAAFTPAELDKAVASLPKANVMGGFAVHSKQFCGSCHGPNGIAPTANWPHVAGQPFEVTGKALGCRQAPHRPADRRRLGALRDAPRPRRQNV